MDVLTKCLMDEKILKPEASAIWDATDGCSAQHRCATALYFLAVLCNDWRIVVDRAVSAPSHGKGVVDGINGATKQFLKQMMLCILAPTDIADGPCVDKKMSSCTVSDGNEEETLEEFKKLCDHPHRKDKVREGPKRAKRELERRCQEEAPLA